MDFNKKHILIVRTSSLIIDFNTYNCQETGLGAALVKKGYNISFITPGRKFQHIKIPVMDNLYINVYTITFSKLNRNLCWYHGFFKLLKEINPDLLHINSISLSMSLLTLLWAKHYHKKTVVVQGNYDVTQKPILKQLEQLFNKTIGRYIINQTNGIGCKTNWACNFIKSYSPQATPQLTRIGLDVSRFLTFEKIDWKKRLNIEGKYILLYVGSIEPRRNPFFLLSLIQKLPNNYCLVIVGTGIQELEMKKKSRLLGIEDKCFFLGKLPQQDLPSLYEVADVFVLPSNYEIFGMVILESMYFGTPVISTLTAGSDAIITNEENGIIMDDLNPDKWKEKILNLVENRKLLTYLSSAAKNTISEHLTWERTANEFISLYTKAFQNDK